MKERFIKPLDIPVIVLALTLTLGAALAAYSPGAGSARVTIRGEGKTWVYPLNAEERLIVGGPLGETAVEISSGRAAIVSSPCEGQSCVAAGALHDNGQWAACLPNRVFLLVEGPSGGEVDAGTF